MTKPDTPFRLPRPALWGGLAALAGLAVLAATPSQAGYFSDFEPALSTIDEVVSDVACTPTTSWFELQNGAEERETADIRRIEYLGHGSPGPAHATGWVERDSVMPPFRVADDMRLNNVAGPAVPDNDQNTVDDGYLTLLNAGFFMARMDLPVLNIAGPDLVVYERHSDTAVPQSFSEPAEGFCVFGAKSGPPSFDRPRQGPWYFIGGTNTSAATGLPEGYSFDINAPGGYLSLGGPDGFDWILVVDAVSFAPRPVADFILDADPVTTPYDGTPFSVETEMHAFEPIGIHDESFVPASYAATARYRWDIVYPGTTETICCNVTDFTRVFPSAGAFPVCLTVTIDVPLSSVPKCRLVNIRNNAPVCAFIGYRLSADNGEWQFVDLSYDRDPGQTIKKWHWDFGHPDPVHNSTEAWPRHQFPGTDSDPATPGEQPFTVTLTVTDSHRTVPLQSSCTRSYPGLPRHNNGPALDPPDLLYASPGDLLDFQVEASDPDLSYPHLADSLTFLPETPASLPAGASLAPDGRFVWQPTRAQVGSWSLGIRVHDAFGAQDSGVLRINVLEPLALFDRDHDGVIDSVDNCPDHANPLQAERPGIACGTVEPTTPPSYPVLDRDGDGASDRLDNCPATLNDGQEDADRDGAGDACDLEPADPAVRERILLPDVDRDGVLDSADNCALQANGDQENLDGDRMGDACDPDRDGDAVPEAAAAGATVALDNCPAAANRDQVDRDGDGVGDACDGEPDGPKAASGTAGPGLQPEGSRSWFQRNILDRPVGLASFILLLAALSAGVSLGVLRWARQPR